MGRGGEEGQRKMGGARGETNLGKPTERQQEKKAKMAASEFRDRP